MKLFRNTSAVLVLTLFTGLAVFTAIQLGGRLFGTPTANAQTVTSQTAVGQSGSSGATDPYGQSSSGSTQTDPYGYGDSSESGSSSGGETYTCPATGCTASTCHATQ
jgi:hypothetical protein